MGARRPARPREVGELGHGSPALVYQELQRRVFVVGDAVGSRAERQADRQFALTRLRDAGCTIAGTETVLFEWTGSGDDAAFGDILKLVKGLPAA